MKILRFIFQAWPVIFLVLVAVQWIPAISSVHDYRFTAVVLVMLICTGTMALGSWLSVPDMLQRLSGRTDPMVSRRGKLGRKIFLYTWLAMAFVFAMFWAGARWFGP
jgi:hypothetical protein